MAVSGDADQAVATTDQAPPVTKTKDTTLKELAGDESLSEEARDAAMKALEALAVSELAEIEQAAALKKMESDQTMAVRKLESDRNLALKKLESELTEMESEQKKRAATLIDMESEAQFATKQAQIEKTAALEKLETEAQFIDQQIEAERKKVQAERKKKLETEMTEMIEGDISAEVTAATRKEMVEWLGRNRLHHHAEVIITVAGM